MADQDLFPSYIERQEEGAIAAAAARVRESRESHAVLLYGPGGVGKTRLVRELARGHADDERFAWLEPVDVDDSEFWLLSNLEGTVARHLDPDSQYFGPYLEYLSWLPSYIRARVSPETLVSHLGRIKRIFVECYERYVSETGKAVVITFDTVESIRGLELLLTFTQWMKSLPATLFILSGRPLPDDAAAADPILDELADSRRPVPVSVVRLGEFSDEAAREYLDASRVRAGLDPEEAAKVVLLTRGHPLWLALAVSYLDQKGVPEEMGTPLADMRRDMPYAGEMTAEGERLHEEFKRRLVTPYREADYWHEAVKRLAAVRRGVNEPFWRQLMADRPLPEEAPEPGQAWLRLLDTPWVRPRGNGRFVTLHDAMAEELAKRVIPLHQDRQWERQLWQRAVDIYDDMTSRPATTLAAQMAALDRRLLLAGEKLLARDGQEHDQSAFISEAVALDERKRDLDQFRTLRLFYQLLSDFGAGCRAFLSLFAEAERDHDLLFQDLLATTMRRFLPGSAAPDASDDVVSDVIGDFRRWLAAEAPGPYREIGIVLANYLIISEQTKAAAELLKNLPLDGAGDEELCRWNILLGNAYLRIPGQVREGLPFFRRALEIAEQATTDTADRYRLIAKARNELGFYYRSIGLWHEADAAYERARDALTRTLAMRRTDEDRAEMATILTNWAYVKGLGGLYRDGLSLIEAAIAVRVRLKLSLLEGVSHNVRGEVLRYEQQFQKAWESYARAEEIFQEQRNWSWLGIVYQSKAICLFQALQDGVNLQPGTDPLEQARDLATLAVDICRERSVRYYPSALNRAARIFGEADPGAGLDYLAEGIRQARALSDGWFWLANLVEYAELSYRAWTQTGDAAYRDEITRYEADFAQATSEYQYSDLDGRWDIVRGHLAIHNWVESGDEAFLAAALQKYAEGFGLIAQAGHVGSSGNSVIPGAFKTFEELLHKLPERTQAEWLEKLRAEWSELDGGSTMLLARLEELY